MTNLFLSGVLEAEAFLLPMQKTRRCDPLAVDDEVLLCLYSIALVDQGVIDRLQRHVR